MNRKTTCPATSHILKVESTAHVCRSMNCKNAAQRSTDLGGHDLAAVGQVLTKEKLKSRPETMWRYRGWPPYADENNIVSLGERMSPLLACPLRARNWV